MSDFIEQIQSDELISGQFYNGEYMPTDQDLEDMNEAWDLDNCDFDLDTVGDDEPYSEFGHLFDDGDALASAGWGTDEDYNSPYDIESIPYEPFEGFDF